MVESMMRANGWEMERHEWLPGGASHASLRSHSCKSGLVGPEDTRWNVRAPTEMSQEEIEKAGTKRTEWPFLEVHALLRARGIRVQSFYGDRSDVGWLLLKSWRRNVGGGSRAGAPKEGSALP